jgi:hypothetical protein
MRQTTPSHQLAAVLLRMNNDALYPVNQFERTVAAVLQRLRGFAPAAIENGVGGGDAGGGSCVLASHDADENADCGPGMAACEGANFNKSLGHARFLASPVQQAGLRQHRREQRRDPAPQSGKQLSGNPLARRRVRAAG